MRVLPALPSVPSDTAPDQAEAGQKQLTQRDIAEISIAQPAIDSRT
jgi:hypothetical protein